MGYKISILAVENCMQSSVTGIYDILSVASNQWMMSGGRSELFELSIVSYDGLPVRSFNGLEITPHYGVNDCNPDIIFIPVVLGELETSLSNRPLINWIKDQNKNSVVICAVCAGVFLAAETRLLKNRTATTHWNLAEDFQKRYPDISLKKEKMLIDEGDFITAGGVSAYMDLALYIAGKYGSRELALTISKILLIDPIRKSQTPYSGFNFNLKHGDEAILKIQKYLEKNYSKALKIKYLADKAGLSERTFARRFRKATGETPLEYLRFIRIGKARSLLETTLDSVDSITYATGYEDVSSFRRLFKKITGLSPSAYRKKFGL
ncbi:MAG: GlxA family transcriptional regulator [Desulfobacterales bacterium]|nr:GlxA family transcriptional regulator [Desulfobacterales bacterium]